MSRAVRRRRALLGVLAAAIAAPARAQSGYPNRPIRLINPYPAGGGSDVMARAAAQRLGDILGQPMVVENRTGASGSIGAQAVAQARPDGYTLLFATGSEMSLKPLLEANLPYDPERDFVPIAQLGITPVVFAVHPALPARGIADLIALARARPGQMNFAGSGSGGVMHMTTEYFRLRAGVDITYVPYRGTAPAVNDAVAGTVDVVVSGLPPVLAVAREGRLRILAVSTPRRTPAVPEVPTMDEAGLPGFDMSNAVGLVAPRGTPAAVVARLSEAAQRAAADPQVRETFVRNGAEAVGSTPEGYAAFIRSERARFEEVVRATGLRIN